MTASSHLQVSCCSTGAPASPADAASSLAAAATPGHMTDTTSTARCSKGSWRRPEPLLLAVPVLLPPLLPLLAGSGRGDEAAGAGGCCSACSCMLGA